VPDAAGLELVARAMGEYVAPDAVVGTSYYREQACIEVSPSHLKAAINWLKLTGDYEFNFLSSVHGVDYHPEEPRLGVHYELLNMQRVERLRIKVRVPVEAPVLDTVVDLFPTADFQEREVYDMFGVVFRGHPDLRRILLPEDYEGHPQRRDFAIGGEPVIFTHNEPESPGWYQ
jgi:NADH-quinone oxidoreductase subunit C